MASSSMHDITKSLEKHVIELIKGNKYIREIVEECDISRHYVRQIAADNELSLNKRRKGGKIDFSYFDGLLDKSIDAQFNKSFYETSANKYYVLGALYGCYQPNNRHNFVCRSRHKELIDIISSELGLSNSVYEDSRPQKNSYFISTDNDQFHTILLSEGLHDDKDKRKFPKIPKKYLRDFIRGFFDARAFRSTVNEKYNHITIKYNNTFLEDLNNHLITHAGIENGILKSGSGKLTYNHKDAIKIYNYIYRNDGSKTDNANIDAKRIDSEDSKMLYLQSKKGKYILEIYEDMPKRKKGAKSYVPDIDFVKSCILENLNGAQISKIVGFADPHSFYARLRYEYNTTFRKLQTKILEEVS